MHDVIKMERTFTYKLTCIFSGLDSFKFRGSSKSEGFVCVPLFNWFKCSGYSNHALYFSEIHLAVPKSLEIMDLHVVKVKSAYEPSGPSGWSLSRFL